MVRVLTAEDRMDQQECRLQADVIDAALAWRKAYVVYGDGDIPDTHEYLAYMTRMQDLEDGLYLACDALLAFLGDEQNA